MNTYTTITDALSGLKEEGYVLNFNLKPDCVVCKSFQVTIVSCCVYADSLIK